MRLSYSAFSVSVNGEETLVPNVFVMKNIVCSIHEAVRAIRSLLV